MARKYEEGTFRTMYCYSYFSSVIQTTKEIQGEFSRRISLCSAKACGIMNPISVLKLFCDHFFLQKDMDEQLADIERRRLVS